MLINKCKSCIYYRSMIAQGLGARCNQEKNEQYKYLNQKYKKAQGVQIPLISNVPDNCGFYIIR